MLYILFNFTMFIRGYIDAQISGARMLYDVYCCYLSELGDLLFLLQLMCASYEHELHMCFDLCHSIFTEVYAMYFLIFVVNSTSMQSSLLNDVDFRYLEFH